jgi:hypothetical protein
MKLLRPLLLACAIASFCGTDTALADELELAAVPLGTAPSTAELVLVNDYDDSLWINAIRFSGPDADAFWASGCAQSSLFPGEECTIKFSFAPRRVGAHVATATVDTAYGDEVSVQLTGTGTASLRLTPATLTFVDSASLVRQPARDVVIENVAGVPLKVRARAVGLDNGWHVRTTGCSSDTTLAPGSSCTLSVSALRTGLGGLPAELPILVGARRAASVTLTSAVPPPQPLPLPDPPTPSASTRLAHALGAALPGWRRAGRKSLAKRGFVLKGFTAPTSGDVTVTVLGRRKLAGGTQRLRAGEHARIPVRFTRAGRRMLAGAKRLRLRVVVKFTAHSDARVSRAEVHLRI